MNVKSIHKAIVTRFIIISIFTAVFMTISLISLSKTTDIDSLLLQINNVSSENKSKIYLSLARKIRSIDIDSSANFATQGYNLAILDNNNEMIAEHLIILSDINSLNGNFQDAILMITEAEHLCERNNMLDLLVKVKIMFGTHYIRNYDYTNSIKKFYEALKITEDNNITSLKSYVYGKIGFFFVQVNDYNIASFYLKKATNYSRKDKDILLHVINLLAEGKLFININNYDSSIYYYKKAIKIARKYQHTRSMYKAYTHISNYYINQDDYDLAFSYIDSSMIMVKQMNNRFLLADLITRKAHIFSLKNDYLNTLKNNLQALSIREEYGDTSHICPSCISIGNNYTELGHFDSAFYFLEKGINMAKDLNRIEFIVYGYNKFTNYYEHIRNFKKATEYTTLEAKYQDSIIIRKTNNQVQFFISQFNLEKEKTYSDLLKIKKKNDLIIFLAAIIFIAIVVMIILISINYFRKKTTLEIEKLSNVINTTSQAVVIAKINGTISYVNNGALKMGRYSDKKDIVNKSLFDFTNKHGKTLLKNEIIPSILTKGKWEGNITLKTKLGAYIPTENYCSVIRFNNSKSDSIVNIFTDITGRIIAEKQLRESSNKLRLAVQTRDKMFSIIAHDLTGPFSSILGFSKLLASEYHEYESEDHIRFSQLIYESSKNTFDLLTNLLHWSRSQLGNIKIITEQTNFYKLLNDNIEPLKLMLKRKEISLHNEVKLSTEVIIDPNTIGVVIRNLLTNAIKFTPRGGAIIITSYTSGNKINIIFSDTGIGIKNENLKYLFDVNNNNTSLGTENEKGTGLGLLLCKEFIELNKGSIFVKSEFGTGSRFTICLPR